MRARSLKRNGIEALKYAAAFVLVAVYFVFFVIDSLKKGPRA